MYVSMYVYISACNVRLSSVTNFNFVIQNKIIQLAYKKCYFLVKICSSDSC